MTKHLVPANLLEDLHILIGEARQRAAVAVNRELVLLYWKIGQRIHSELLHEERATYGQEIISTLSAQLEPAYGRGFDRANLYRMVQFAKLFSEKEKVVTLSRQLSWSHFLALLEAKLLAAIHRARARTSLANPTDTSKMNA